MGLARAILHSMGLVVPGAALVGDAVAGACLVRHHEAGEGGAHVGGAVAGRTGGEAGGWGHRRGRSDGGAVEGVLKGWTLTQNIHTLPYLAGAQCHTQRDSEKHPAISVQSC